MSGKPPDDSSQVMFDPKAVSILQSIFKRTGNEATPEEGAAKTASVKFMITLQDEEDLRKLGYSQAQIHKLKPQEAKEILQAGKKAEQDTI
jgi:hypothetical protein